MADPEYPHFKSYSVRTRMLWLAGIVALFLGIWGLSYGLSSPPPFVWSVALIAPLILATAIDLKHYILPDWITLPLILLGLWVGGEAGPGYLWSGIGALIGFGLIAGLRWLWLRRKGVEAIGLGDAKLLGAGGAWLGAAGLPVALLVASGLAILSMLLSGQTDRKQAIPFGPFLGVGIWFTWCLGHWVMA